MKINVRRIKEVIILIFIALMCRIMYLLPEKVAGININDITMILFTIYFFIMYIKYKKVGKYEFGLIIIGFTILVMVASIQGHNSWGQSVFYSFTPQRAFLLILLSYFPLNKYFKRKRNDFNYIFELLVYFGILQSCIYLVQHFIYPHIVYINCQMNMRMGLRIYVDSVVIEFMIMYCFSQVLEGNRHKIRNMLAIALGLLHEFLVSQGRLECCAILLTLIIGFLFWKRTDYKKIIGIGVILFAVVVVINSNLISSILEIQDSGMIREAGRALYLKQLTMNFKTLLLGCGYPNSMAASIASGSNRYIYLVDNGIFAFFYVYGLIGIMVVVAWIILMLKKSISLYKKNGNVFPIMFILFNIIIGYNIIFWWWKPEWTFVSVIFMCYLERRELD